MGIIGGPRADCGKLSMPSTPKIHGACGSAKLHSKELMLQMKSRWLTVDLDVVRVVCII